MVYYNYFHFLLSINCPISHLLGLLCNCHYSLQPSHTLSRFPTRSAMSHSWRLTFWRFFSSGLTFLFSVSHIFPFLVYFQVSLECNFRFFLLGWRDGMTMAVLNVSLFKSHCSNMGWLLLCLGSPFVFPQNIPFTFPMLEL